ncbi:hypothetical protein EOK75_17215 (plasmid) [Pseudorhodobacter turbinis]|uniref:Phage tail protein n=1 Tax=Pseudorhodobacter turbinis TaxID=2500533 RepID=A0A4P8EKL3_9RHOB|nr:hypothetical protein [Pseudorhodobacter turbinis]QCO57453.1 hypothetical protein EOK75_17215 [Pseudorhodobacter turbinis]
MAGITGRAAGFIATLYYVETVMTTKDATTVAAGAVTINNVKDVADMGTLSKARTVIDIPVYGDDVMGKLPGQADPGEFTFNVTLNNDNVIHKSLRDDSGKTEHTFIIKFSQDTNETYCVFDGYVATADVSQPRDDRIQMDISIARSGAVTWIDAP